MAQIILDTVCKTYLGGARVVKDVSLEIEDGEFLVLVGPSGCGKSTTLRMIAGLESVSSGTISIGGRVVNDVPPKDRDIAMVFQSYALYPHMTVRANLEFALRLRKASRAEISTRVAEVSEMLGLTPLLERRPAQLSGGQRQRVALGRAIVRKPAAFLFDEPLSNLDAKLRASMRTELKALHQRLRTTTVYVTHDQEEAMTLGDRIVVMESGQIQQSGAPLDVYRKPANQFVASFIGQPQMNFFEGTIRRDGAQRRFVESGDPAHALTVTLEAIAPSRIAESQTLTLGVRPQHLRPVLSEDGRGEPGGSMPILSVDPLGEEVDIVFETPTNARAISRVPMASRPGVGRSVPFDVDARHVHLFDAQGRLAADL